MDEEQIVELFSTAINGISTLISLVFQIAIIIGKWKLFELAGEAGWKSIIPFVDAYTIYKIAYGSGWKFLLVLVPFLGEIFLIMCPIRFAQAYGRSTEFGIGLLFLKMVFYPIMAFDGKSQYQGPCNSFL